MRRSYAAIQGDVLRSGDHPKDAVGLELKLLDLAKLVRTAQECQQQSDLLRGLQEQQLLKGIQALQTQLYQLQSVVFAKPLTSCSLQLRASSARSSTGISAAGLAAPVPGSAPVPLITGGASERHHPAGHLAVVVPAVNGPSDDCVEACGEQLLLARRSEVQALAARVEAIERNLERAALEARQVEEAREQSEELVLERLIALECSVACAIAQPGGATAKHQQVQPRQHPQLEEDVRQLRRRLDALAARVGSALTWLDGAEDASGGDRPSAAATARDAAEGEEDAHGGDQPPAVASLRVTAAPEGADDAGGDHVATVSAILGIAATAARDMSVGLEAKAGMWMGTGGASVALGGQGCRADLTVERLGGGAGGATALSGTEQCWATDGDCRAMAPEGSSSTESGAEVPMLLPARLQAAVDRTAQAAVAGALRAWKPNTSASSAAEPLHLRGALGAVQVLGVAQQALSSSLGHLEALCPRLLTTLHGLQSCNASGSTGGSDDAPLREGDAAEGAGLQARAPGKGRDPQREPQLREAYALAQEAGGLVAGLKETLAGVMAEGQPGGPCLSRNPSSATAGAPTEPPISSSGSGSQGEAPSRSRIHQQEACILPTMPHTISLASKPAMDAPVREAERLGPVSTQRGRPTGGHTQDREAQALAAPAQEQGPLVDPVAPLPGPRPPDVPSNAPPGAVEASRVVPRWTDSFRAEASAPVAVGPVSPVDASKPGAAPVISLSQLAVLRGVTTAAAVQEAQQHPQPPALVLPTVSMGMAAGELSLGREPSHQPPSHQPPPPQQQQQPSVCVVGETPAAFVFAPAPLVGEALRSTEQHAVGVAQHRSALLNPQQQAAGPPRSTVARAINFTATSAGVMMRGAGSNNDVPHGAGVASARAAVAHVDSTSRFEPHAATHAGTAPPTAPWAPGIHGVPPQLQHQQTQTSTEARGLAAPKDNPSHGYSAAGSCLASALSCNLAADGRADPRYRTLRKVPSGDSSRHLQDDVLLSSPPLSYDSQCSPRIQPLSRLALAARRADARRHNAPAVSTAARCAAGCGLGVYGTYDTEDDVSRWGWLSDDEDERGEFEEGRRQCQQRCTTPPRAEAAARSRKVLKGKSAAGAADGAARATPRRRVAAGPRTPSGKAGAVHGAEVTRDQTPVVLRAPWSGGKGRAGCEGTSPGRYAAGRRGGGGPGRAVGGGRGVGSTKKGAASVLAHTRLLGVGAVKSPMKSH